MPMKKSNFGNDNELKGNFGYDFKTKSAFNIQLKRRRCKES